VGGGGARTGIFKAGSVEQPTVLIAVAGSSTHGGMDDAGFVEVDVMSYDSGPGPAEIGSLLSSNPADTCGAAAQPPAVQQPGDGEGQADDGCARPLGSLSSTQAGSAEGVVARANAVALSSRLRTSAGAAASV